MSLISGRRDRRITIQTAGDGTTASGYPALDWTQATEVKVWAEWLPGGTQEAWRASQRLSTQIDGVFRIPDLDPRPAPDNSRILFQNRIFDIKPWIEIGRGVGLEIPVVAHAEGELS